MLVPSPNAEIKALIGDKNADEMSDLSENSDTEMDNDDDDEEEVSINNKTYNSSIEIIPTPKVEISTITIQSSSSPETEKDSLISADITDPNIVIETSNNLLNLGVKNSVLMGSTDRLLNELTVDVNQSRTEEDFNSIISPTHVLKHRKSIDRLFEEIVTDDNNNNKNDEKSRTK
jgi:hypothetical protein